MYLLRYTFFLLILIAGKSVISGNVFQNDTIFNQTDQNKLKQGFWKKSYPNGKVAYRGFFKDDKPRGVFKRLP